MHYRKEHWAVFPGFWFVVVGIAARHVGVPRSLLRIPETLDFTQPGAWLMVAGKKSVALYAVQGTMYELGEVCTTGCRVFATLLKTADELSEHRLERGCGSERERERERDR